MKKFILCLIVALSCLTSYSQIIRDGNTLKQIKEKKETPTQYKWEDSNNKIYLIYKNKKGRFYIKKVSKKTQKEYRYYLPKEVQEELKKLNP